VKIDFKFYTNHLLKSEILRSASVLISGSVIAQLLSILLRPILTRLFSPESFGIFSVYMSLVGIIVVLSSLRYDDAIVLPKTDKESTNVLGLALIINLIISIIIFSLVVLFGNKIIPFLGLPSNFPVHILYIIPFSVFLSSSYQSLNSWLIRKKKYISVSVNKLIRRSSEGAAQICFALFKSFNGLIYSDIVGQTANVATVAIQTRKNRLNLRLISIPKLKYVLRKYSEFPKFNLIPALMSSSSYLLPPIFINKFYSPETLAFFDLPKLLLSIPLAFIAGSISNVLLQKVSEKFNRKESLLADLKPVLYIVLLISILEIIAILLFGENLFKIVFGDKWIDSGKISKIMVWSFAANFVASSFTSMFVAMRRIKIFSIWQSVYFIFILSLLFFKHLPFNEFLKIYVAIDVFFYIVVVLILFSIIYRYESSIVKA
jgi:O-antigen/teichoic acid export membrane protein